MQDWPRPQSFATLHIGVASCAVTQTPARQYGPDEPAQLQSTSPPHDVRQTALTHAWPAAHWADAVHSGLGPTSGWQMASTQRLAAPQAPSLEQRAWQ